MLQLISFFRLPMQKLMAIYVFLLMLCASSAQAAVLVTKPGPRVLKQGTLNGGGHSKNTQSSSAPRVTCDGVDVLRISEENGATVVKYRNTGETGFETVSLPSENDSWEAANIYLAGCTLEMTGGKVGYISSGTSSGSAPASCHISITGGVVKNLDVAGADLVMCNAQYTGTTDLSIAKSAVVYNCTFTDNAVKSKLTDLSNVFTQRNVGEYIAKGEITIPAGMSVTTPRLEIYSGCTLTNNGSIHVTTCNGFTNQGSVTGNTITMVEHNLYTTRVEPTCTQTGKITRKCVDCNYQTEEELRILEHQSVTDAAVPATCESTGLTEGSHCKLCGEVLTAQVVVPALGHTYGEWTTIKASTCTSQGAQQKTCTRCNHIEYGSTGTIAHTPGELSVTTPATCTTRGFGKRECTVCQQVVNYEVIPARGHDKVEVEPVRATCETGGNERYTVCSRCHMGFMGQYSIGEVQEGVVPDVAKTSPIGHLFTVENTEANGALIHAATCTEKALYRKSCLHCGSLSDAYTFSDGPEPTGHSYYIVENSVKPSPDYCDAGELDIACHNCNERWANFEFCLFGASGTYVQGKPFNGYWYTCRLDETLQAPTCKPGRGKYLVTLNYCGTMLYATFENGIPPTTDVHNWSPEDGICHETHYQYKKDANGDIIRDSNGNFEYELDSDGNLIPDDSVYSATASIKTSEIKHFMDQDGNWICDEDHNPMTYVQWSAQAYDNVIDALDDANVQDAVVTLFKDFKQERDLTFPGHDLTIDLNGHTWDASYTDSDNNTDYWPINIQYSLLLKNGTLNAKINSSYSGIMSDGLILDNMEATTNYIMYMNNSPVILRNHSTLNISNYLWFENIDIDNTSKMNVTGIDHISNYSYFPGGKEKIIHYLPAGWTTESENNGAELYVYDADHHRMSTYLLDGSRSTGHTMGYMAKDVHTHYQGCTICGYSGQTRDNVPQVAHTYDADDNCTVCGYHANYVCQFTDSNGNVVRHESLKSVIDDEDYNRSEILMIGDLEGKDYYIYNTCCVNLNGHRLSSTSDYGVFNPYANYYQITVKGTGYVNKVVVEVGTSDIGSALQLMGGTYGQIVASGNCQALSSAMLAPGYLMYFSDGTQVTDFNVTQLENVTVRACSHVGGGDPGTECSLCHGTVPYAFDLADGEPYTNGTDYPNADVTYTRTFTDENLNKWNALYLPISVAGKTSDYEVASIYVVTPTRDTNGDGVLDAQDDHVLVVKKLSETDVTKPNTPYLIRPSVSDISMESVDGKLQKNDCNSLRCATTETIYTFTGTYSQIDDLKTKNYWFMGNGTGTINYANTTSVSLRPYRWYLTMNGWDGTSTSLTSPSQVKVSVMGEDIDEATAIRLLKASHPSAAEAIFTIDGRRMAPGAKLPAGVYVKNGKKVIIK